MNLDLRLEGFPCLVSINAFLPECDVRNSSVRTPPEPAINGTLSQSGSVMIHHNLLRPKFFDLNVIWVRCLNEFLPSVHLLSIPEYENLYD